jgi:hypothetical protein
MPREPEEENVRSRVRQYLDGALTSGDGRSLAVRTVARFVPCSPTTVYKYGLDKDINRVADALKKGESSSPRTKPRSTVEDRVRIAQQEAAEWKAKYENVLTKLILIEYHLKGRPGINLDELYATPMPAPDRSEPYQPRNPRPKPNR